GEVLLGSSTLTLGGANQSTSYSGVMSGAGGGFTKTGSGTLVLSGAATSTYTGLTSVEQGTLELASIQRLGGDILIHGDSTLALDDGVVIGPGHGVSLTHSNPAGDDQSGFSVEQGKTAQINVGINELVSDTT